MRCGEVAEAGIAARPAHFEMEWGLPVQSHCDLLIGRNTQLDPYQAWLGIPRDQQPCSLYQLLGVSPVERDEREIEAAAVSRMSRVRCYQLAYPGESTRLLTEIALALDTLIDPVKRRAYDALLEAVSVACSEEALRRAAEVAQASAGAPRTPTRTIPDRPTARKRRHHRTKNCRRALRWDLVAALRPLALNGLVGCEVVLHVQWIEEEAPGDASFSSSRLKASA
jgi:hypothetical protein